MQLADTSRASAPRRSLRWLWLGTTLLLVLTEWGVYSIRGNHGSVPIGWVPTAWATTDDLRSLSVSHNDRWVKLSVGPTEASASQTDAGIQAVACQVSGQWYELPRSSAVGTWHTTGEATVEKLTSVQCLAKVGEGEAQRIAYVEQLSTGSSAIATAQVGLLLGLALGVPVSYAVLVAFRRRVKKGLRDPGSRAVVANTIPVLPSTVPGRSNLLVEASAAAAPSATFEMARRTKLRLCIIWMIAAAVVALLCAWMYAPDGAVLHRFPEFARLWFLYVGPIALPLLGLVALHRRQLAWACAGYLALLLMSSFLFGPDSGIFERLSGMLLPALGILLALVLAHRRVRAFVPTIVLTSLLFLGAQLPLIILSHSSGAIALFSKFFGWFGFKQAFAPLLLAGLLAAALALWATWRLLRALGRGYHAARLNDRLLVGMLVTLFAVLVYTIGSSEPAVVAAFLPIPALMFVAARGATNQSCKPRILFLRVFGRGNTVADRLEQLCRDLLNVARVDMIAGPDLATAVVQPTDLLDFLVGKFSRKYIHDLQDFAARLDAIGTRPDLEGRQRVRDFYCANTIWKDVFGELARSAESVVIDLSQFTRERAGTAFELETLVHHYPLDRVVAIVDTSTDRGAVAGVLEHAWNALPADSPNRSQPFRPLAVFEVRGDDPRPLRAVLDQVCRITSTKRASMPIDARGLQ